MRIQTRVVARDAHMAADSRRPTFERSETKGERDPSGVMVAGAQTHGMFAEDKLSRLCVALGLSRQRDVACDVFRCLAEPWAHWPLGATPAWATDICDDGTPFELSVAFDGLMPSLRMLVESQQSPMGPNSTWDAGLRLSDRLRAWPGVDLARQELVVDLFAPTANRPARFSLWHAADIAPDGSVSFKVYLNPRVRGPDSAVAITLQALQRLEMHEASDFLRARVRDGLSPLYVSLDLSSARSARVKVYLGHENADPEALEGALAGCLHYVPGDASRWIEGLVGTRSPSAERPILTCFAFVSEGAAPLATVHVPIRCHVSSDAEAVERAARFLNARQARLLQRAVDSLAGRSLVDRAGLISYVSLRRTGTDLRVATYLSPEAYTAPRLARAPSGVSELEVAQ